MAESSTAPAEKSLMIFTRGWWLGSMRSRNFSIWELISSRLNTIKMVTMRMDFSTGVNPKTTMVTITAAPATHCKRKFRSSLKAETRPYNAILKLVEKD